MNQLKFKTVQTFNRWMDASTGMDPKEALDKALSDQMMNIAQKKKVAAKERVKSFKNNNYKHYRNNKERAEFILQMNKNIK